MAAFRTLSYNVASEDGRAAPVSGAQVTASAFAILARPPLLGRTLDAADQVPGSPNVVVIGHDLWAARFGSDPGIVGRTVRIAGRAAHRRGRHAGGLLLPGAPAAVASAPRGAVTASGEGRPPGRLGTSRPTACPPKRLRRAERRRDARSSPTPCAADARLQPEVVPFGMSSIGLPRGGLHAVPEFLCFQILAWVLLLVACGNVAMLVFARTATRFRELAVRTALGASRARIVSQMFVETLVLAVLAAGIGVFSIGWMLGHVNFAALAGETSLPYWLSFSVTGDRAGAGAPPGGGQRHRRGRRAGHVDHRWRDSTEDPEGRGGAIGNPIRRGHRRPRRRRTSPSRSPRSGSRWRSRTG